MLSTALPPAAALGRRAARATHGRDPGPDPGIVTGWLAWPRAGPPGSSLPFDTPGGWEIALASTPRLVWAARAPYITPKAVRAGGHTWLNRKGGHVNII